MNLTLISILDKIKHDLSFASKAAVFNFQKALFYPVAIFFLFNEKLSKLCLIIYSKYWETFKMSNGSNSSFETENSKDFVFPLPLNSKEIYRLQISWREIRIRLRDAGAELFLEYANIIFSSLFDFVRIRFITCRNGY